MPTYTPEQLEEAREALRLRGMGMQPASVKYDGREVTYAQVSLKDLEALVSKMELALAPGKPRRRTTFATDRGFNR